ncbi:cyclin-dependent kinase 12 [Anaeramoeba flamelloides]|uniref:Cyclin-dependent kinase 12 n=1 Tax=Anaeramoeba flamelloides TaxID=1746091 RepID=A0ABQ8ZB38_9EUKA|nr:cyclin-dependent kinase 12 [Anaeramoeba flamelloides]
MINVFENNSISMFHPSSWGAGSIDKYQIIKKIGKGVYGEVYKGICKQTGKKVALKKINLKLYSEGFPHTAIREITIVKILNHENVVKLFEIVKSSDNVISKNYSIYIVFEYLKHDLSGLMLSPYIQAFALPHIKSLLLQLCTGLAYIHENGIIHRDIKTSNLFLSKIGLLKIGDFGLARQYYGSSTYTKNMVTISYRAPELLLGDSNYTNAIDMWSVGCIFAELLLKVTLFPEETDIGQLELIWELCGTPDVNKWKSVEKLELYQKYRPKKSKPRKIKKTFAKLPKDALNLLDKFLKLNPSKRITAKKALKHQFFKNPPFPSLPKSIVNYPSSHEMGSLEIRKSILENIKMPKKRFRTNQSDGLFELK